MMGLVVVVRWLSLFPAVENPLSIERWSAWNMLKRFVPMFSWKNSSRWMESRTLHPANRNSALHSPQMMISRFHSAVIPCGAKGCLKTASSSAQSSRFLGGMKKCFQTISCKKSSQCHSVILHKRVSFLYFTYHGDSKVEILGILEFLGGLCRSHLSEWGLSWYYVDSKESLWLQKSAEF